MAMMKRALLYICFPLVVMMSACSTDINLYADYKQVPVVYGLLDAKADTNFIKITRVFYAQGDAYQVAQNPDSSDYPGKLDVRLVEYCNNDSIREIVLDTITIRNKQPGTFYAPCQKMYYTTERLGVNTQKEQYSYRLKAVLPDRVLTTKADLVGNDDFDVQSLGVNFSKEYFGAVPRRFLFSPAVKGAVYQITLSFTFLEQRLPDGDSVPRTMTWDIGTFNEEYFSLHTDGDAYYFLYRPETFYAMLRDFVGDDTTLVDVQRYITDYPAEVTIVAGGEKLRQYVYNNNTEVGFMQGDNEFSLIDGGYGVFSSRMTVSHKVRLAGETVPDLVAMSHWRFKFIGGE
jgi:hypothetical protein